MSARLFPTRKEFREWREQNPERGAPKSAFGCPLAECLSDRGAFLPWVTDSEWGYYVRQNDHERPLPVWAREWVAAFDGGQEALV